MVVFNGRVELASGANVTGDVVSQQAPVVASGATIGGTTKRHPSGDGDRGVEGGQRPVDGAVHSRGAVKDHQVADLLALGHVGPSGQDYGTATDPQVRSCHWAGRGRLPGRLPAPLAAAVRCSPV